MGGAEAVPNEEHFLLCSTVIMLPAPRSTDIKNQPGLVRHTRRVNIAAAVGRENVRAQTGREGLGNAEWETTAHGFRRSRGEIGLSSLVGWVRRAVWMSSSEEEGEEEKLEGARR